MNHIIRTINVFLNRISLSNGNGSQPTAFARTAIGRHGRTALLLILFQVASFALASDISGATFTVTNTNDTGVGSLRQAIAMSGANRQDDTIVFDPDYFNVPRTITLSTGMLSIPRDLLINVQTFLLTIKGPGADILTIDANQTGRILKLETQSRAAVSGLRLTGGNGQGGSQWEGDGGGILVMGSLELTDSVLTGNYGQTGGGIYFAGSGTIINCLIANNTASAGGGFAVQYTNQVRVFNSTISSNVATNWGGGVWNTDSIVEFVNSTVAFNRGGETERGAGIWQSNYYPQQYGVKLRNTILANNTRGPNLPGDVNGRVLSQGHNIIQAPYNSDLGLPFTILGDTTGNQIGADPQLTPELQLHGGMIPVHSIPATSPAIDSGNNCVLQTVAGGGCVDFALPFDQRGMTRPLAGSGDESAIVDVGSFEFSSGATPPTTGRTNLDANDDSGISSSDNITRDRDLTFSVGEVAAGATVDLFRDNTLVATKIATGTEISLNDPVAPADGTFLYTARQTVNGISGLRGPGIWVTVDNTAPAVTVDKETWQEDPISVQPIRFTMVFSELVFGLSPSDASISGSAGLSNPNVEISSSGTTTQVLVSNITSDGTVTTSLPAGVVTDAVGNLNSASTSTDNTVLYDITRPTVAVSQAPTQLDPTRALPVNFTVVFSESVTGFTNSDVSLAGSSANVSSATKTVTGSGTTYNVAISGFSTQGGTVVVSIPAFSAQDAAYNFNQASTSTDNSVIVDNVVPTVTINQAAGQADPANTMPVNFSVVFSEPVTGFDAADVSLSGSSGFSTSASTITVTGTGAAYNVAIGNISTNLGSLRVAIRSAAAVDSVNNNSTASTSNDNLVQIDNVSPILSINQEIGQADPTTAQPVRFAVVFNEVVTGFGVSDLSLQGSTADVSVASIEVSGSGNVYHVRVGNILSSGTVRLNVATGAATDATGNASTTVIVNDNTISFFLPTEFDYDGDGRSDLSLRRPTDNVWYLLQGTGGYTAQQFGEAGDRITPADYDGDGKTDVAVFRPLTGTWFVFASQSQTFQQFGWGAAGDLPVPTDRDNDGKADLVVFRPSNNTWYTRYANGTFATTEFGVAGDKPLVGDFDADGIGDIALFRPSNNNWYILKSSLGFFIQTWGETGDIPVPADFDGDGATDQGVFRPSTGQWFLSRTTDGFGSQNWGQVGDIPVAADYDGDGKADVAVFRPANGTWYIVNSSTGQLIQQFGQAGDVPTQSSYLY